MLDDAVEYRHGSLIYPMRPGDTLFVEADSPQGRETVITIPARNLSITTYPHA
jgi:hypothetical protein